MRLNTKVEKRPQIQYASTCFRQSDLSLAGIKKRHNNRCYAFSGLNCFFYKVLLERPKIRERINSTRKMKNNTFAIPAAPAAIPPNPKIAAITATIRKITVHRNIGL
jgi:hypothetical protein